MNPDKYFKLITGQYEPAVLDDRVSDFGYSPLNKYGLLYQPVIDSLFSKTKNIKPTWPEGKNFAVCLTHDVDVVSEYNLAQNMRSILKLAKPDSQYSIWESLRLILDHKMKAFAGLLGKDDEICKFEEWMALEKSYNARSTLFFPPEQVGKAHSSDCMYKYNQLIKFRGESTIVAEMMRTMDHEGWEIGLHPSWHAHADLDEMKFQKGQIESILNHSIQSVRQHFLKYDPHKTHRVQSLAGFKYDSTLGFNDNVGFRRGTSYPFNCFDLDEEKQLPLLQIPLVIQDGALLDPEKGLRLDLDRAIEHVKLILARVQEVGGVLTLSWHPHTMNRPHYWRAYKNVLELLAKENPWFATVNEVGEWWKKQNNVDLLKFTQNIS